MKKIFFIPLCFVIALCLYLVFDYTCFAFQSRNSIKKILVVSEGLEQDTLEFKIAQSIALSAEHNRSVSLSLIGVHDLGIPFFNFDPAPAQKPINDPEVKKWADMVRESDAIIFLAPNYNNGYSAGIKNAIDVLWKEWHNKPVGVIGYSTVHEDGSLMMYSFERVLHKIKSDPVANAFYFNSQLLDIDSQMSQLMQELYSATQERHYFRQLYRSVLDTIFAKLLAFMNKK